MDKSLLNAGYKLLDKITLQTLYMSEELYQGCLELYQENADKYAFCIHYDTIADVMHDTPHKSMFIALDMLKEMYNDVLIQEISTMDPTKEVCVIVALESLNIFKHVFFARDAAMYLPHYCSLETCGKLSAKQRCTICKNAWYCDAKCQKLDWKKHKNNCEK